SEAEASHHFMWLHIIAEQVARAEFRAVAALVACRFAYAVHVLFRLAAPLYKVVIDGQYNQPCTGLCDRKIQIELQFAHHNTADKQSEIGNRCAARHLYSIAIAHTDGSSEGDGSIDCAGDGNKFLDDWRAAQSARDVIHCFNIIDDNADIERDTLRRYQPARRFIYQHILIT